MEGYFNIIKMFTKLALGGGIAYATLLRRGEEREKDCVLGR